MNAPPLLPAMLAAADRVAFPVLITAYEVPFVALSRAVVHANRREEQEQLSRMVRMYDRVRRAAIEGHDAARLIDDLAAELDCDLHVVVHDGAADVPRRGAARRGSADRADRAARRPRVRAARGAAAPARDAQPVLAVPVPSTRAALLVVAPRHGDEPSLALLQHVATIVALEVEKLTAEREHRRRIGSELLASIVDGRSTAPSPRASSSPTACEATRSSSPRSSVPARCAATCTRGSPTAASRTCCCAAARRC